MNKKLLPAGFEELEAFAERWAKPSFAARYQVRITSTMDEIQTFYQAMISAMDRCAAHFDGFAPTDDLPDASRRLLYLTYAAMNVSPAVELYKQPDVWLGFEAHRVALIDRIGIGG
ncbi:hypothetical protein [Candidatus Macondimonas diazotrophica]|uniref:Uncharacterized protein n=1 Tax=Candidatus Macondimonas diazotrophica TaxID=2305248 RepID=A0A4Z0FAR7_9GAMM|nr:hypothetical protein [Candidatus Macondimonas diazotrophica]NCU00851.1 hypothetical protein [Candidatus Macondimonas diazotrophica]TFZ82554.1 hypothetical protein E4680_07540 [Candidatus Macondimonas diazotrophica]HBG29864.1 hypothetical protein [Gammaproteobacteria bacterium]HBG50524.1 hypothetical protein [Gammaproteobacteria bacterium]